MTDEAYECFCKLREQRFQNKSTVTIDGYSDFVFTSKKGKPIYPGRLNDTLRIMVDKYNKKTQQNFPYISNHIFRHSGCTNMAQAEVDSNVMMHVMGHRNLKMIMKVYDSVRFDRVQKQMDKMKKAAEIKRL